MDFKELYKNLSHEDCLNSFEYTNRLQNDIITKQANKINYLTKQTEQLKEEIERLKDLVNND